MFYWWISTKLGIASVLVSALGWVLWVTQDPGRAAPVLMCLAFMFLFHPFSHFDYLSGGHIAATIVGTVAILIGMVQLLIFTARVTLSAFR